MCETPIVLDSCLGDQRSMVLFQEDTGVYYNQCENFLF